MTVRCFSRTSVGARSTRSLPTTITSTFAAAAGAGAASSAATTISPMRLIGPGTSRVCSAPRLNTLSIAYVSSTYRPRGSRAGSR